MDFRTCEGCNMRPMYTSACKFYVHEALIMSGIVQALPHMAARPKRSNLDPPSSVFIFFLLCFFSLSRSHLTRPLDFVCVANTPLSHVNSSPTSWLFQSSVCFLTSD